ncbi:MFS transporter [Rhodococcus fascians]|nr:MFS transporter [Rhodococcus fascians]
MTDTRGLTQPPTNDAVAVDIGDPDDPRAVRGRERGAYVLGDLAFNLAWTTVSTYLLFFYTDVALISAGIAGTIILGARVLDAFFDPVVGLMLDRTSTRWGRARPFLLFGAPLLAVLSVLAFTTPAGGDDFPTIAWAAATFLLVGLAYSLVNVPYGAAIAMSTRDSGTRMKLAGYKTFGLGVGLVIVSTATQPLIVLFGGAPNSRLGFMLTITLYAVAAWAMLWFFFATAKERVPLTPVSRNRGHFMTPVKNLLGNRPWISVFAFSLLAFARLGVITGGTIYYALYVLESPAAIGYILLTFSMSAIAGSFVTAPVLARLGQRRGIIVGLAVSILLTLSLVFLQENLILFLVVFFVANIAGGFGFVATSALIADTVEWNEYQSGSRDEGLLFAGYSMSTKIGAAIGSGLLAWSLAAISYNPAAVTEATSNGIMWLYIILPAAIGCLQAVAIGTYGLEKRLPSVTEELRSRRAGTAQQ